MKTKKHLVKNVMSFMAAVALIIGIILVIPGSISVHADQEQQVVTYIDANGQESSVTAKVISTSTTKTLNLWGTTDEERDTDLWFVVTGNVDAPKSMQTMGKINLILADGAHLNVNGSGYYGLVVSGNYLNIFSQSLGSNMGKMTVTSTGQPGASFSYQNDLNMTINGGEITITAESGWEGISCYKDCPATLTVNNGNVIINGGSNSKAVGEYITIKPVGGTLTLNDGYIKVNPTVTVPTPMNLTYTGQEQELITAGSSNPGTMTYSLDGTNYSEDIPKATAIGTYTVYYKVDGSETLNAFGPYSIQASIKNMPTMIAPSAKILTYTGQAQELVTKGSTNYGTFTYSLDNINYSSEIPRGTEVGTYTIYYKVDGSETWYAYGPYATQTSIKYMPTVIAPTPKTLTYTGQEQELIEKGSTNYGTMVYSLDDRNYSEDIPAATAVGTYNVYYKVYSGETWNEVNAQTVKVTIQPPTISYLDASGNLQSHEATPISSSDSRVDLGGNNLEVWCYVDGNVSLTNSLHFAGTVHLILADGAKLTIGRCIYFSSLSSLTIYSQSLGENMGSMTVSDTGNYNGIDVYSSLLTINGGNISFSSTSQPAVYIDDSQVTINNGNVIIASSGNSGVGFVRYERERMTVAGGYVSISGGSGNVPVSDVSKFTKTGGTVVCGITTEPTVNTGLVYDGTVQELVTAGSCGFADIQYSTDGTNYSNDIPTATDAGTYTVSYKVVDGSDAAKWNFFDPKTIEVKIKYKVSFDAGEGTGSMDYVGVEKDAEYTLPENTFTAPEGRAFKGWSVKIGDADAIIKQSGDKVTITANTTITAVFEQMPITYIGADGNPVQTTDYTIIDENTTEWSGTMVAQGAVKIDTDVNLTDNTTLILCDDAELGLEAINGIYDFTIYCQSKGNGIITTGSTSHSSAGSLNIFGGGLIDFCYGINCGSGDVIIKDCQTDYSNDNGHGIGLTGGTITLGWNKPTTCISFSSYNGNVKLEKSFDIYNNYSDETSVASIDATGDNYLTDDQKAQIAGKYLRPAKCTVAVTPVDKDGKDVNIQGNWLNKYLIGTSVTLTAPAKEGYNFSGWYEGATEKCKTNSYTFTITENKDLTAVYEPLGKAELIIKGGDSFTINSETYNTILTKEYQLGSKITVETNGDKFAYWQNKYGMVLSRSKSYTFTVTGADEITAIFDTVADNKAMIVFESAYGQVLLRKELALGEGSTANIPGLPILNGYTPQGWDFDGDGSYDSSLDTIEKAITRGLNNSSKTVTIRPVYELKNKTYTITVVNGTGGGTFNQNDKIVVVANSPESGKKFSHWLEGTNIVCYNTRFEFFVDRTLTLEAVYVDIDDEVEAKGMTEIIEMYNEGNNLVFVSLSTVPEGFKIVKAGVILTNNVNLVSNNNFDDKNATYVFGDSWSGTSYRYTLTKTNAALNETWYARGYLVYTDNNGNTHTIYSDVVNQKYLG
jgi:uncharacterized repeat protein (TIGR02543 family)